MIRGRLSRWFELTREEQCWIAGILAIFLVGLAARWYHLAHKPAHNDHDSDPSLTEAEGRVPGGSHP